jgi:DNA-binding MurR/RpiR family transcriptional regulator
VADFLEKERPVAKRTAKKFLALLRGSLESLKPAESKTAKFILADPERVIRSTITEVAEGADVAEATVVRLARKFNFSGYQEMKISLARELVGPVESIHEELDEKDSAFEVFEKVFAAGSSALTDTLAALDEAEVNRAVEALASARRVLFVGVGTSGPNVLDAHNKFIRLGLNTACQTDSHLQVMEASLLGPRDVVVGISHSGSTKDPIETLKAARQAGAVTICITNNALSPITKVADISLFTASRETRFRMEAMASRLAQSAIINSLWAALALRNISKTRKSMKRIEDAIVIKQF